MARTRRRRYRRSRRSGRRRRFSRRGMMRKSFGKRRIRNRRQRMNRHKERSTILASRDMAFYVSGAFPNNSFVWQGATGYNGPLATVQSDGQLVTLRQANLTLLAGRSAYQGWLYQPRIFGTQDYENWSNLYEEYRIHCVDLYFKFFKQAYSGDVRAPILDPATFGAGLGVRVHWVYDADQDLPTNYASEIDLMRHYPSYKSAMIDGRTLHMRLYPKVAVPVYYTGGGRHTASDPTAFGQSFRRAPFIDIDSNGNNVPHTGIKGVFELIGGDSGCLLDMEVEAKTTVIWRKRR